MQILESKTKIKLSGKTFKVDYKAVLQKGYVTDLKFTPSPKLLIAALKPINELLIKHAEKVAKERGWRKGLG